MKQCFLVCLLKVKLPCDAARVGQLWTFLYSRLCFFPVSPLTLAMLVLSNRGGNEVVYSVYPLHIFLSPSSTLNKIWQQFYDAVCDVAYLITWDIACFWFLYCPVSTWYESWLTKIFVGQSSFPLKRKKVGAELIFIAIWDIFLLLYCPGTLEGILGEWSARCSTQTHENLLDHLKHHSQSSLHICFVLVRLIDIFTGLFCVQQHTRAKHKYAVSSNHNIHVSLTAAFLMGPIHDQFAQQRLL